MTLVLYHDRNYKEYIEDVQKIFEKIPNKNVNLMKGHELVFPFDSTNLGKFTKMKSLKKQKTLNLTWILQEQQSQYRNPPLAIISHVLSHEGKGTLKDVLFNKNLIYDLSSNIQNFNDCFSMFQLQMTLTKKGYKQLHQIIKYIGHYICMMKDKGIPE